MFSYKYEYTHFNYLKTSLKFIKNEFIFIWIKNKCRSIYILKNDIMKVTNTIKMEQKITLTPRKCQFLNVIPKI